MSGFTVEYWNIRLNEIQEELTKMTGRPGFSLGSMTVDEKENYERLRSLQLEAQAAIGALGEGDAGTRNGQVVSTNRSW